MTNRFRMDCPTFGKCPMPEICFLEKLDARSGERRCRRATAEGQGEGLTLGAPSALGASPSPALSPCLPGASC